MDNKCERDTVEFRLFIDSNGLYGVDKREYAYDRRINLKMNVTKWYEICPRFALEADAKRELYHAFQVHKEEVKSRTKSGIVTLVTDL